MVKPLGDDIDRGFNRGILMELESCGTACAQGGEQKRKEDWGRERRRRGIEKVFPVKKGDSVGEKSHPQERGNH